MGSPSNGSIEHLAWDSDHFGCAVARVSHPDTPAGISAAVATADAEGVDCLTSLVDAGDQQALEGAEDLGFHVYDVRIDLDKPLEPGTHAEEAVHRASDEDLAELEEIARTSFRDTRFYADPRIADDLAAALYVAWVRRGVADDERQLLTAADGAGFLVCHLDPAAGVGTIELIAVAAAATGAGRGSQLVRQAERLFAESGLTRAQVATQGRNVPAQRLYQRHGYRTRGVSIWLHRWRPSRIG